MRGIIIVKLKTRIGKILRRINRRPAFPPKLEFRSFSIFSEFSDQSNIADEVRHRAMEAALANGRQGFLVPGICYPCRQHTKFWVDYAFSYLVDEKPQINWRSRLTCQRCSFNSRLRATLQTIDEICQPDRNADIYITEQTTSLFKYLKNKFPNAVGSEFLGDKLAWGAQTKDGIRNETLTRLTFPDSSFDLLLSFDVLEHIPDYKAAVSEIYRTLKPGGTVLFSVPFTGNQVQTLIRATISPDGTITHLTEPEYHGDPMSSDGILCFQTFGWDLLDDLRNAGFADARVGFYWDERLGYLGDNNSFFIATKPLMPAATAN